MTETYRFGCITIKGKNYYTDVLEEHPDILIVGTAYFGRMVIDPEVPEALKNKGLLSLRNQGEKPGKCLIDYRILKKW